MPAFKRPALNPERLSDFLFETGMLRRTPRSGYQFLGSGNENVAEHSFGAAATGFVLAHMAGADASKVAMLCLFHDLHESRTGDCNYVNKRYVTINDTQALHDAVTGTGIEEPLLAYWEEWRSGDSPEAILAHDADTLDLMFRLKEELDLGNSSAKDWLQRTQKRLRSDEAKQLANAMQARDHTLWWKEAEKE